MGRRANCLWPDGHIGSIFGWGFAPFQGRALQFINAYGPKKFVERARELAMKYGARFEPAGVVVKMAEEVDNSRTWSARSRIALRSLRNHPARDLHTRLGGVE